MKRFLLLAIVSMALSLGGSPADAAGAGGKVKDHDFSFDGPFGRFDQYQLQRGAQVFQEVCSACHGLRHVAFRTLGDEGGPHFTANQVKGFAQNYEIFDADLDDFRTAKPADKFPASAVEGAPDLSLMAKARAGFKGPYGLGINQLIYGIGGPEYILAILTGYTGKEREEAGTVLYENTAFPGGWISMAPPLVDAQVDFADGHKNDIKYMAQDVAAFLAWTAEPHMMTRKRTGFLGVAFLGLLTLLLYLTNKKLWAPHKYRGTRK